MYIINKKNMGEVETVYTTGNLKQLVKAIDVIYDNYHVNSEVYQSERPTYNELLKAAKNRKDFASMKLKEICFYYQGSDSNTYYIIQYYDEKKNMLIK